MNDLMIHVAKSFTDELDGVKHYFDMATMAEQSGNHGNAAIFRDMAREEFCHAKHLKEIIHENHTGNPPANHAEMMKKFRETKAMVEGM